jgi:hypothetical protein
MWDFSLGWNVVVRSLARNKLGRWLPALLALVGSLALASGLFVAVITMTRTPANHAGVGLTARGAVYVGGDNTCFTCHGDSDPAWAPASQPVPASHPSAVGTAGTASGLVEVSARVQVPRVGGESITNVAVMGALSDTTRPDYVIATENDRAPAPGHAAPGFQASPGAGSEARCAECHTEARASGVAAGGLHVQSAEGMCAICHTNTRRVSRAAHPVGSLLG